LIGEKVRFRKNPRRINKHYSSDIKGGAKNGPAFNVDSGYHSSPGNIKGN
jgi:hypothetical protein